MNARPVTDSPIWEGSTWRIEVPNPAGGYQLFQLSLSQEDHDRSVEGLKANGYTDFKAYEVSK